ncbi:MAG: hypothetical protein ABII27_05960 [bacterium]
MKKLLLCIALLLAAPKVGFTKGFSFQYRLLRNYLDLTPLNRYAFERGFSSFDFGNMQNNGSGVAFSFLINNKLAAGIYIDGVMTPQNSKASKTYTDSNNVLYDGGVDTIDATIYWIGLFIERRLHKNESWETSIDAGVGLGGAGITMTERIYTEFIDVITDDVETSISTSNYMLHIGIKAKYKYFKWGKIGLGCEYDYVPDTEWKVKYSYSNYPSNYSVPIPDKLNLNKYSFYISLEFGGGSSF